MPSLFHALSAIAYPSKQTTEIGRRRRTNQRNHILDLRRGNELSTAFLFTSRIAGRRIRPSTSHGEAPIDPFETKGLPHEMAYTCCCSLPDTLTYTIIHYGQRRTKAQRRARQI